MSWFSELEGREKVLILGGGVIVGLFFIKGIKGSKAATTTTPTSSTDQAQQTSDLVGQMSQQQSASQASLMDALGQMNQNITQAISTQQAQSVQMFQQSEQDMLKAMGDNQKQTTDAITQSNTAIATALSQGQQAQSQALSSISNLLSKMQQSQQQAPVYSMPSPTTAPSAVVPQSSGGTISSPFATHSFETNTGDNWSQSGNTVTVHDSLGGVGTYNTDTHNSSWDYSHENIPSLSAAQVAQAKANAIAGKPLF